MSSRGCVDRCRRLTKLLSKQIVCVVIVIFVDSIAGSRYGAITPIGSQAIRVCASVPPST